MIELQINKRRVVLPRSLNMKVIEENPFFTKNGTYTLDITLSLEEDENAIVYQHLNRMNVVDGVAVDIETGKPLNRTARLVVDNEVVLNGTEIITAWTNTSATIQLVSGNSELNFIIGGDRKLRDLDLGKAERYTANLWWEISALVVEDMRKTYPERNWLLIPYATGYNTDISSSDPRHLEIGNSYIVSNAGSPLFNPIFSGQVPQPFLCFIIQRVIESLGYTFSRNVLAEHEKWKHAYLVNGIQTFEFAKMLPDWTVNEFMTEIEQFFDCSFIVNGADKTVQLLFNYQADSDIFGKADMTIIDEYTAEIDRDNNLVIKGSNIGYSLDSNNYMGFMNLDQRLKPDDAYIDTDPLNILIDTIGSDPKYNAIYKPSDTKAQFIAYHNGGNTLKKVDSFRPLLKNTNSEELDIEFKIVPASMIYSPINAELGNNIFFVQIPVAGEYDALFSNGLPEVDPTENINIQKIVEDNSDAFNETMPSKIRLALYTGLQATSPKYLPTPVVSEGKYPSAYVEYLEECFQETKNIRYYGPKDQDPFRLENMYKDIYSKTQSIDTTKTYKLTFIDPGKIDIMSKFIANNKAFRCAKIERTITIDGFAEIVNGDFYPYNI